MKKLKNRIIIPTGSIYGIGEEIKKLDDSHPFDLDGGKLYAGFHQEKKCWEDIIADICNDWFWMITAVLAIVLTILWIW